MDPISIALAPATQAVGAAVSGVLTAALTPINYNETMSAWRRFPVLAPPPDVVFNCLAHGFVTPELAAEVLKNQGIGQVGDFQSTRTVNHRTVWDASKKLYVQRPSVGFIMEVWSRGYWNEDSDRPLPLIREAGGDPAVWQQYISTFYEIPDVGTLMEARNRGFISNNEFHERLKKHGYGFQQDRAMYDKMRDRLPGPSDLIHFAVKEAFSIDVANDLRLYDEFPWAIAPLMRAQGLGWETNMLIRRDGLDASATVMDLYWASHWQPISAGQAFEMLHRLRPDRLQRYRQQGLDVTAFGMAEVRQWLRINDYPPTVRDNLAALSYNPLRLYDIRNAVGLKWRLDNDPTFRSGVPNAMIVSAASYDRAWGIAQFQDRGVHPDDAGVQVDLAIMAQVNAMLQPARSIARGTQRKVVNAFVKGYTLGIVERQDAIDGMVQAGLTTASATQMVDLADVGVKMQSAQGSLKAIRRSFLSGGTTFAEAETALRRAGFTDPAATDYVNEWNDEFNFTVRAASTEKVLKWLASGYMTVASARERLVNLGWSDPDTAMLLQDANGMVVKLQAQALRAMDLVNRRNAAELEKARKAAIATQRELEGRIRRLTPVATLQRWLRKAEITRPRFLARLKAMGYNAVVANLYADDALRPDPKKVYPPDPKTTTPGTTTPPGAPGATQPAAPGAVHTVPPVHPAPLGVVHNATQPEVLNTQPLQLHTPPRPLGQPDGQGR